jgi:hypothetical protein
MMLQHSVLKQYPPTIHPSEDFISFGNYNLHLIDSSSWGHGHRRMWYDISKVDGIVFLVGTVDSYIC